MKRLKLFKLIAAAVGSGTALALIGVAPLTGASAAKAAEATYLNTQTADVLALLTAVHKLTSYNGDPVTAAEHFAAWRGLWAEDATFVVNQSTTYTGRDDIMSGFFANAPFFHLNWVGLSPNFRTEVAVHGDTAEVYLECIFLDETKTIKAERSISGTVKKINGEWSFWRMNSDPAHPLF